ncbi:(d)CMP kinase [Patescibacteria group bacterium]
MRLLKKDLQIAIDGPVASGKSIGAHLLAKKLNILYVYSGAMYRAVAFIGLKHGLDLEREEPLIKLVKKTKIKLEKPSKKNRVCDVLVNGKDITDELFTSRMHWGSSQVAIFPKVRKHLVALQQKMAKNQAVVMEGRDITTVVLPKADLKIYMTADLKVRAKRRLKDLQKSKEKVSLQQVIKDIQKRDYNDTHRKANPLKVSKDAWVLKTSKLSINEEIESILLKLKDLKLIKY